MTVLLDWLMTPEAQSDPHYWASVALAHAALGIALTVLVAALLRLVPHHILSDHLLSAVQIVALGYAGWEAAQMAASGTRDYVDALVDWTFITGGAVLAWAIWRHRRRLIAAILVVLAALAIGGISRRR